MEPSVAEAMVRAVRVILKDGVEGGSWAPLKVRGAESRVRGRDRVVLGSNARRIVQLRSKCGFFAFDKLRVRMTAFWLARGLPPRKLRVRVTVFWVVITYSSLVVRHGYRW